MDLDRFLGGGTFEALLRHLHERPDTEAAYISPLLNSFPGNISEYGKPLRNHGKAMSVILGNLSRVVSEVHQLNDALAERLIDLKECVNQLIFQEKTFGGMVGPQNIDYSSFYSKFLESLSVWRRLSRAVHRQPAPPTQRPICSENRPGPTHARTVWGRGVSRCLRTRNSSTTSTTSSKSS